MPSDLAISADQPARHQFGPVDINVYSVGEKSSEPVTADLTQSSCTERVSEQEMWRTHQLLHLPLHHPPAMQILPKASSTRHYEDIFPRCFCVPTEKRRNKRRNKEEKHQNQTNWCSLLSLI